MTPSLNLAMRQYSMEPRTRKYVKEYGFLSFVRKYNKELSDARLHALKTFSKKLLKRY